MNNNTKARRKAMTKQDRKNSAKQGFARISKHAKVARCKSTN